MKLFVSSTLLLFMISSCGTSLKAERAEAKRKKEAAQLEQLEKDKTNFEQKNRESLGQ